MVSFDSMVRGKISSEKLQAKQYLGISLALAHKGVTPKWSEEVWMGIVTEVYEEIEVG
jgi:hypothetical protein